MEGTAARAVASCLPRASASVRVILTAAGRGCICTLGVSELEGCHRLSLLLEIQTAAPSAVEFSLRLSSSVHAPRAIVAGQVDRAAFPSTAQLSSILRATPPPSILLPAMSTQSQPPLSSQHQQPSAHSMQSPVPSSNHSTSSSSSTSSHSQQHQHHSHPPLPASQPAPHAHATHSDLVDRGVLLTLRSLSVSLSAVRRSPVHVSPPQQLL